MYKTHSNFWIGNFNDTTDVLTGEKAGKDYVKLAATLRAVGNFVQIVTGKNIPVNFHGSDSYTNGKEVTISANVKDNNFDATVGLALHEGSHIKLSNFELIQNLDTELTDFLENYGEEDKWENRVRIKDILNVIEDRRIDYFIYKNAPGYRPYYDAMYDKYFNSKAITKGLKSSSYRDETWDSYMFRLINITNSARDLDALKGLKAIWTTLDLGNISLLKDTSDALEVAKCIFSIIHENVTLNKLDEAAQENESNTEGTESSEEQGNNPAKGSGKSDEGKSDDDGSTTTGEDVDSDSESDAPELSTRDQIQVNNAIRKQKDFMDGKVKKSNLSKADRRKVKAVKESGASTKDVGKGANSRYNSWKNQTVECVVISNLSKSVVESGAYGHILSDYDRYTEHNSEAIAKGVRLGTMLGRKLQVRNSSDSIKFNRLRTGKIDRRAIASLGYGAEAVFQKVLTTAHKDSCLHISIDASGSMGGNRWYNSQTAAVAIAKAASMADNMDVVISYRSIYSDGKSEKPLTLIAYDSRKDKFSKITSLFKYIIPGGTTPAGLCFESIMDHITGMGGTDKYFINFSDGEPYFENGSFSYYGHTADNHIRKQVNSMRAAGIKILSYFIDGDNVSDGCRSSFDLKYGKEATRYIGVTELMPLAKSLNKRFVEK